MKGLVIAANRLPIEISADGSLNPSPGGLASALSSVTAAGTQWVGWAGPEAIRPRPFDYGDLRLHPVTLSSDEVDRYYSGFSNAVLWPLFHGRLRKVELNRSWWNAYRVVNRRFANAVTQVAPLGGTAWVHDYHLLLTPAMIREKRPDLRIGLFLHIPFPNAQLFAMLPWRSEVIKGMLGADVIGFQVPDDVSNFIAAAKRLVDPRIHGHTVFDGSHSVDVDAFPISVDFAHWDSIGQQAAEKAVQHRHELGVEAVLLGIDRLDYTKGISQRLRAFGELLDQGLLPTERCTFVQVAVPSRADVAAYEDEREEVEALIERINSKHRRANGSMPVLYLDYSLDDVEM
ncbi:MAG: trehalose 6-phosphate synthase, partial [Baekduia sp.]|nr:trehalose 6-phosphate synthase [Baekduia sp.]